MGRVKTYGAGPHLFENHSRASKTHEGKSPEKPYRRPLGQMMRAEVDTLVSQDPYFEKARTFGDVTVPAGNFFSETLNPPRPFVTAKD